MTTYQITNYKCPFCRKGNVRHINNSQFYKSSNVVTASVSLGYYHICDNCGMSMQLDKPYPIETKTETTEDE